MASGKRWTGPRLSVALCVRAYICVRVYTCARTHVRWEGHIGDTSPSDAWKELVHVSSKSGDVNLDVHVFFPCGGIKVKNSISMN